MGGRCCQETQSKIVEALIGSDLAAPEKPDSLDDPHNGSDEHADVNHKIDADFSRRCNGPTANANSLCLQLMQKAVPLPPSGDNSDNFDNDAIDDVDVDKKGLEASVVNGGTTTDNVPLRSNTMVAQMYSPPDAPLLFGYTRKKKVRCCCCTCKCSVKNDPSHKIKTSLRRSTEAALAGLSNVEIKYDMWVMPVSKLLELEKMEPHQVLMTKGLIMRWKPVMQGRIIFVSHQWLGFEEPDPDSIHLRTLQCVLTRLMNGEIEEVKTDWKKKGVTEMVTVRREEWVAALPYMYVWLDYFSMPQVSVDVPEDVISKKNLQRLQHKSGMAGSLSVSYAISVAGKKGWGPAPSDLLKNCSSDDSINLPSQESHMTFASEDSNVSANASGMCSDHRYSKDQAAKDLQNAVASIPAYVNLSSLLLVLVPICRHHDTAYPADYSTWRNRGWCRMEMMSAVLSRHKLPMMLVTGPQALPMFITGIDAVTLPPGTGNYTCCALDHQIGDTTIPCDKERVLPVMEILISSKINELANDGFHFSKAMYASYRKLFLRGLPGVESTAPTSLAELKELIDFDQQKALSASSSEGNLALLQLAVQFDAIEIAREILDTCNVDVNSYGFTEPALGIPELPLLAAATNASSFDMVKLLLERRANPAIQCRRGLALKGANAFHVAVFMGRQDIVQSWLDYFPDYDLNSLRMGIIGLRMIHCAIVGSSSCTGTSLVHMLITARADPLARNDLGGTGLHLACLHPDLCEEAINDLIACGVDVNAAMLPQNTFIRRIMWFARRRVKFGDPDSWKMNMAIAQGARPLHLACKSGKYSHVARLLEAHADPNCRNVYGVTPLELTTWVFHEAPPLAIELLGGQ